MMYGDDFEETDVDAPIPYVLTPLARRELADWRLEERLAYCRHVWGFGGDRLECQKCGLERVFPASGGRSVPQYLDRKPR